MTTFARCPAHEWFEVECLNDAERERKEQAHRIRHDGEPAPVAQLATVVGWTEALEAARTLAATGREFTLADLPDVADHRTNKGRLAQEIHRLGIAHPIRYDRSHRKGTKASAVAVWQADRDRCIECPRQVVSA